MSAEPTLGEILGAILGSKDLVKLPFGEWEARDIAATTLSLQIAEPVGITPDEAWDTLCTVPDNMLGLLDSPQGWSALAGYVAAEHGVTLPDFLPTLH